MNKIIITGIAIAYNTKFQFSPGHEAGRIGSPLLIQEEDIPDTLREEILSLIQKHAKEYWRDKGTSSEIRPIGRREY